MIHPVTAQGPPLAPAASAQLKHLSALFPKDKRQMVKDMLRAAAELQADEADELSRSRRRFARSIGDLEAKEAQSPAPAPSKIVASAPYVAGLWKFFPIEAREDRRTYSDSVLGPVEIFHHDYLKFPQGQWFEGLIYLYPDHGGVSYVFRNGLPAGTLLDFYLKGSWSKFRAVTAPPGTTNPAGVVEAENVWEDRPDFTWQVVKRRATTFCINTIPGCISLGIDCMVRVPPGLWKPPKPYPLPH